jgi:hypothetical protein
MNKPRFLFLAGVILLAAASRLIPHPANFSPVAALALFSGAKLADSRQKYLVPLAAMFLSDLVLGLDSLVPVIYGSFALMVSLGSWLKGRQSFWVINGAAVAGAALFFILTNFGVWAVGHLYPKTVSGLIECFIAGIPFLQNTLLSNLIYTNLLFGGLAFAESRIVTLRESSLAG